MSSSEEEFPLYMKIVLVTVGILVVLGIVLIFYNVTNSTVENDYIDNADCNSLKHYIDAGRQGKDYFAHWTYESQETINFSITDKRVDRAQLKYQWNCADEYQVHMEDLKEMREKIHEETLIQRNDTGS